MSTPTPNNNTSRPATPVADLMTTLGTSSSIRIPLPIKKKANHPKTPKAHGLDSKLDGVPPKKIKRKKSDTPFVAITKVENKKRRKNGESNSDKSVKSKSNDVKKAINNASPKAKQDVVEKAKEHVVNEAKQDVAEKVKHATHSEDNGKPVAEGDKDSTEDVAEETSASSKVGALVNFTVNTALAKMICDVVETLDDMSSKIA